MKIGKTIIEDKITIKDIIKTRETVRGVVLKDSKVLMLYSKRFDDYTFPGGGKKENETHEKCLKRELYEEIGALKVELLEFVGYIEEVRHGISGSDSVYNQKSYYYLCNIDEIGKPNFAVREKEDVLVAKFIDLDEAIMHNNRVIKDENHQQKGFKTVLLRENQVLKYIKNIYFKKNS